MENARSLTHAFSPQPDMIFIMDLSIKEARRIVLHGQGLLHKEQFGRGINAVQRTIDRLHYIQIDTISVVARAHNHVLRTRVSNYAPKMLHELLANRRTVFEYWSHAAAYLPISDYRYYLPVMKGYGKKHPVDKKMRKQIISRINDEGPLQSRDFEDPRQKKSTGWWDWKPAKLAMEVMFLSGELMVRERRGFQKVYDLTDNVLPVDVDRSFPSDKERGHFYVRRMLASLGISQARDIGYAGPTLRRLSNYDIRTDINHALAEMTASGEVTVCHVEGAVYYCLTDQLETTPKKLGHKKIRFLSPFDNLVINRRRLAELFDFDYQLECYVPEPKRKFGYFTLPMLYGDQMIGRLDCKADRKSGCLRINNIWLETLVKPTDELIEALVSAFDNYAIDLACENLNFLGSDFLQRQLRLKFARTR